MTDYLSEADRFFERKHSEQAKYLRENTQSAPRGSFLKTFVAGILAAKIADDVLHPKVRVQQPRLSREEQTLQLGQSLHAVQMSRFQ